MKPLRVETMLISTHRATLYHCGACSPHVARSHGPAYSRHANPSARAPTTNDHPQAVMSAARAPIAARKINETHNMSFPRESRLSNGTSGLTWSMFISYRRRRSLVAFARWEGAQRDSATMRPLVTSKSCRSVDRPAVAVRAAAWACSPLKHGR